MSKMTSASSFLEGTQSKGNLPFKLVSPVNKSSFGRFSLVGKLGHGGIAELLLAVESELAQGSILYVIKRLHHHLEDDQELVTAFLNEARIATLLKHRNIVRTFNVGEVEGSHYLAMEYLEGQGFDRILRRCHHRGVKIPPAITAAVIAEVLNGLNYAHDLKRPDGELLNVLHRDVRPHNIFVSYDGTVKLLDFGIARAAAHEPSTKAGLIKGKLGYIAPEQALGEEIDRRADLWSCGVVFWEALTERRLFESMASITEFAKNREILESRIGSIPTLIPDLSEELVSVVTKSLRCEKGWRYQTAREMRNDILAALPDEPIHVPQQRLSEFMIELFADTIEGHRKAVQSCLGGDEEAYEESLQVNVSGSHPVSSVIKKLDSFSGKPPEKAEQQDERFERMVLLTLAIVVFLILTVAVLYRYLSG